MFRDEKCSNQDISDGILRKIFKHHWANINKKLPSSCYCSVSHKKEPEWQFVLGIILDEDRKLQIEQSRAELASRTFLTSQFVAIHSAYR